MAVEEVAILSEEGGSRMRNRHEDEDGEYGLYYDVASFLG
jgi:hypothetical protein